MAKPAPLGGTPGPGLRSPPQAPRAMPGPGEGHSQPCGRLRAWTSGGLRRSARAAGTCRRGERPRSAASGAAEAAFRRLGDAFVVSSARAEPRANRRVDGKADARRLPFTEGPSRAPRAARAQKSPHGPGGPFRARRALPSLSCFCAAIGRRSRQSRRQRGHNAAMVRPPKGCGWEVWTWNRKRPSISGLPWLPSC